MNEDTQEQLNFMSRYVMDVAEFAMKHEAKAAYCFVIDGNKGTGGCPVVVGMLSHPEYISRCRELVAMLRRSADWLERDIGDGKACWPVTSVGAGDA